MGKSNEKRSKGVRSHLFWVMKVIPNPQKIKAIVSLRKLIKYETIIASNYCNSLKFGLINKPKTKIMSNQRTRALDIVQRRTTDRVFAPADKISDFCR